MSASSNTSAPSVVRPGPAVGGCLLFFLLMTAVPLLWALFVPIGLLPAGRWLYILCVVLLSASVFATADHSDRRRATFVAALLALLLVVILVASAWFALDTVLSRFGSVDRVETIVSPSGRLALVHDYMDEGALGGDSHVYVRGRLIPGLLEWRYDVDTDSYPDNLRWVDERTVAFDLRDVKVPEPIVLLAW